MLSSGLTKRHNQTEATGETAKVPVDSERTPQTLTQKEVKFLKRQARKRKWVRRLQKLNNYCHALCKCPSYLIESATLVWMGLSGVVIYKTNFFR